MTDSKKNSEFFGNISEVRLNELRQMIIGLDTEDLQRLSRLINNPEEFSKEISELLPHSIKLMLSNKKVSYAELIPVVESVLKDSITKNPHTLSDILFPVMLPAIRKAVAEDIKNMLDSLNTTLEQGFSPKRIGWRLKSIFSGVSYAEIVLSNAYIYRVKQVFLIHKKTGLLINSFSDSEDSVTKDDDMVSSMLSAIKDFVQDSFTVDKGNELNTIAVGKFNIWIEQGPGAILAAIVDGDAPTGFRKILKETIEKVHLKQAYDLEHFDGNIKVFEKSNIFLQSCIISEQKKKKKKKPWIIIILLSAMLIGAGYWAYVTIEKSIRFTKLEKRLNGEPGIVITERSNNNGKVSFLGLKDPSAENPLSIASHFNIDSSDVEFNFSPYISLDGSIILKKANAILKPPKEVILSYNEGTLYATGEASDEWYQTALRNYSSVPGVYNINFEKLEIYTPKTKLDTISLSIENYYFVFNYNAAELNDEQKIKFDLLIDEVNTMLDFNFSQDSVPVIMVIAHTSYEGNAEANEKIAFERAQQFINLMIKAGIPMEVLVPKTDYIEDIDYAYPVRSVSFKLTYSKPEEL